MRRFLGFFAFGGLLGVAVGSLTGPRFIEWWSKPPVPIMDCSPAIGWVMESLVKAQLTFAVAFALVMAIGGLLLTRAWRNRAAQKASRNQAAAVANKPPT